jgi:amidohydrolase
MPTINRIAEFHPEMTEWRRDFHAHPEIAYEEFRTSEIVAAKLEEWGIEVHRGLGGTGVVGTLRGAHPGPEGRAIGLRADMDALPMQEEADIPHASRNPGRMHACGHDGHTTMLLGAARYLAETRNFAGTVRFIFQPAEEGRGGAKRMVEEGLLDLFPCDEIFGIHNWPSMPVGTMGVRSGAMMAAADLFEIRLTGRGGHGAMPHFSIDPVVVAAHLVTALQTLVSRNTDPADSSVLSVTKINGGTAFNVIPNDASIAGTIRTFRESTRDMMEDGVRRIATSVAAAFGATAEIRYQRNYPATVNSASQADFVAEVAAEVLGAENVRRDFDPSMGAEDFSFMLQKRPGAYLWLGQGGEAGGCMLHNPRYDFNDEILPLGASLWVRLVERALAKAA